jgi:hypothetical protein
MAAVNAASADICWHALHAGCAFVSIHTMQGMRLSLCVQTAD